MHCIAQCQGASLTTTENQKSFRKIKTKNKNPTYLTIFFRSIIWEPENFFCMALVTTKKVWLTDRRTHTGTDRRTDRQTPDKVIPMCRYALQATQKWRNWPNMVFYSNEFIFINTVNCFIFVSTNFSSNGEKRRFRQYVNLSFEDNQNYIDCHKVTLS